MAIDFVSSALRKNYGIADEAEVLLDKVPLKLVEYDKGQIIHRVGDDVRNIYCMEKGWVASVLDFEDGNRQLLNFYVPIDIVGLEFLSNGKASTNLVALEKSSIFHIPVKEFIEAVDQSPGVAMAMLSALGRKYVSLQWRTCIFALGDASAKVAHLLIGLRAKQIRNKFEEPNKLRLPLTQSDIADALGMSNVTVSRVFTRFSEKGLVTFSKNAIVILNPDRLAQEIEHASGQDILLDEFG